MDNGHEQLVSLALDAIRAVYKDTSVSDKTRGESLETLDEEIIDLLATLPDEE